MSRYGQLRPGSVEVAPSSRMVVTRRLVPAPTGQTLPYWRRGGGASVGRHGRSAAAAVRTGADARGADRGVPGRPIQGGAMDGRQPRPGSRITRRSALKLGAGTVGAAVLGAAGCAPNAEKATGGGGGGGNLVFLSTQLAPVEEAEKMRQKI